MNVIDKTDSRMVIIHVRLLTRYQIIKSCPYTASCHKLVCPIRVPSDRAPRSHTLDQTNYHIYWVREIWTTSICITSQDLAHHFHSDRVLNLLSSTSEHCRNNNYIIIKFYTLPYFLSSIPSIHIHTSTINLYTDNKNNTHQTTNHWQQMLHNYWQ